MKNKTNLNLDFSDQLEIENQPSTVEESKVDITESKPTSQEVESLNNSLQEIRPLFDDVQNWADMTE